MDYGCDEKKKNKTMADKLYSEIIDASQNKGSAIKREDTQMAEVYEVLLILDGKKL